MAYRTTGRDSKPVTDVMRWEVWNRDNFTCVVCGSRMFLEVDHVVPVSKGGSSHLGNLQTLCQNCNVRKKDHSRNLAPGESCTDPECGHAVANKDFDLPISSSSGDGFVCLSCDARAPSQCTCVSGEVPLDL